MADTRTEELRDPLGNPNGSNPQAGALGELGGPVRNRPAAGAREADSVPSADARWRPGPGATDFLGLEPDLQHGEESSTGGPTESWLFGAAQADADFAPTAVSTATPPTRTSTAQQATPAATESSPSEFDAPFDARFDDLATEVEPVVPPARKPMSRSLRGLAFAAAFLVLSAGGYLVWQRFGPKIDPRQEVANVAPEPTAPRPAKPTPDAPVAVQPVAPAPALSPTQPTTETANSNPDPLLAAIVPDVEEIAFESNATPAPAENATSASTPAPVEPVSAVPEPAPLARSTAPTKVAELPLGQPGPGGGRRATAADWAGMWLETTIPTEAIRGPTRVRTLHVGLVRAELRNREFIEGALYAVGESRIWLDVALGRLSLDADEVRELVQIVGQQGQPIAIGVQALAGLPRVEVLLPGGTMTGRVLGREGDWVTFITEDGMRMRVDALDIRPAPDGRTRLVGAVKTKKP